MARFRTLVGLGLASTMLITAPVFAAATTAKPAAKPVAHALAKPATTKVATAPARTAAAKPRGRMVTARLANGKTVTYDCSLAGNKTKQACKG